MPPNFYANGRVAHGGEHQWVEEMVISFTHTVEMPWILPGVAPTGRHVEVPMVAIMRFRDGKLAHEHIYWDQASVFKQIGLLTDSGCRCSGQRPRTWCLNRRTNKDGP
jgi:carboxymethylenebutenolidase